MISGLIDSSSKYFLILFRYQRLNPYKSDWLSIGIQNVVTGCACMVNRDAIMAALPFPKEVIMHDWWLALVSARIGDIYYLPEPLTFYRQHSSNLVGAKGFYGLLISKFLLMLKGQRLDRSVKSSLEQLKACNSLFPDSPYSFMIKKLSDPNPIVRLIVALRLRLTKHGFVRTLAFYCSLLSLTKY